MAILASDIASRMRQTGLDAEGTDHYRDDIDIIPAINSAITWLTTVIEIAYGGKKFTEELTRELRKTRIWQTNDFSRFRFNSAENGHGLWTVLAIHPKPCVFMSDFDQQDLSGYSATFAAFVSSNMGNETCNKPILDFDPITGVLLLPHASTLRPELSFVSAEYACKRLTDDEYVRNRKNPFEAGNNIVDCDDLIQYAYLNMTDYSSLTGGYITTPEHEFEVRPLIKNSLVAMTYISVPPAITLLTENLPFPAAMFDMIVAKSLQFVSYKQGDQTSLYTVTQQDIQTLLTATN